MTTNLLCSGRWLASAGDLQGYPCKKRGRVREPDGTWYCAEHAPSKRRAREAVKRRPAWAMEACRELIHGGGDSDSMQRTIDLARVAVGADPEPDVLTPTVAFPKKKDGAA